MLIWPGAGPDRSRGPAPQARKIHLRDKDPETGARLKGTTVKSLVIIIWIALPTVMCCGITVRQLYLDPSETCRSCSADRRDGHLDPDAGPVAARRAAAGWRAGWRPEEPARQAMDLSRSPYTAGDMTWPLAGDNNNHWHAGF
jgi:hypothetical protein